MKQNITLNALKLISTLTLSASISLAATDEAMTKKEILAVKEMAYGHLKARAIHIACAYNLLEPLISQSLAYDEVAAILKLHAPTVKRILRVLENHGFVRKNDPEKYTLTKKGLLLTSASKHSLKKAIAKEIDVKRWAAIGSVDRALKDGGSPFKELFNMSFYEYLKSDPVAASRFNEGMSEFSKVETKAIVEKLTFAPGTTFCDIGGGSGELAAGLILKNPNTFGIVLDLEEAIKKSDFINSSTHLKGIIGNFFEDVPAADIFVIKRVLHNWDDVQSAKILSNCVANLKNKTTGRVYIIEKVIPEHVDGSLLIDSDLIGLALGDGYERTQEEFTALTKQANLEFKNRIDTDSGVSILEFSYS